MWVMMHLQAPSLRQNDRETEELKMMENNTTLRSYEFTKRATSKMMEVVTLDDFDERSAEAIYNYLVEEFKVNQFHDYLKRHIYKMAEMEGPFCQVEEDVYLRIIRDSFMERQVPFSYVPIVRKSSAVIREWLRAKTVRRDTIFLLGFGLGMTEEEISVYLTKVIKEQDFNFNHPREVIFWYCYHHRLGYGDAIGYLNRYEKSNLIPVSEKYWMELHRDPETFLLDENQLLQYLYGIDRYSSFDEDCRTTKQVFDDLYYRAKACIVAFYRDYYDETEEWNLSNLDDVTPAVLESILYSGVPFNQSGNIEVMSRSKLKGAFDGKRLTRQRIDSILKKKVIPDRSDLMTILFLIYALTTDKTEPAVRIKAFVAEMNRLLERCRMYEITPVNPYESMVMMCICSVDPIAVYNDIWEMSYIETKETK